MSSKKRARLAWFGLGGLLVALGTGWARGDTHTWDGNGASPPGGPYHVTLNWNPNGKPAAGDTVVFNLGSTYTVTFWYNEQIARAEHLNGVVTWNSLSTPRTYTIGDDLVVEGELHVQSLGLSVLDGLDMVSGALYLESGAYGPPDVAAGWTHVSEGALLSVDDGAQLTVPTNLLCDGALAVSGGGQFESSGGYVEGDVTVSGHSSAWLNDDVLSIGKFAAGTLTVQGGGRVTSSNSYIGQCWEGKSSGGRGAGTLLVTGYPSKWENAGEVIIGGWPTQGCGTGTLTVRDYGRVTIGGQLRPLSSAAGGGTVSVEGGWLEVYDLQMEGGVVNLTGGRLLADTIHRNEASGGAFNFTGGVLSVTDYSGNLVNSGGTFAPGDPIGHSTVSLSYTQNAGKLDIDIGGPASSAYDRLTCVWDANLDGQLEVFFRNGYVPTPANQFVVVSARHAVSGEFSNAERYVPVINGGGFNVTYGMQTVTLSNYQWRYPYLLLRNTTDQDPSAFIGPPDDYYAGVQNDLVDLDFGKLRVVDGPGPDFNVYELDSGGVEFNQIDVLVSNNGTTWVSVKGSEGPVVRIPGDQQHSNNSFSRSYDLIGSGLSEVRYVRVAGTWYPGSGNGFDLDSVGAIYAKSRAYPVDLWANTTGQPDDLFIGPPDDQWSGIGGQVVAYDFSALPVIDATGPDFNVYEVDFGGADFALMDVQVSADGLDWISVKASEGPVVRIPGDEQHSNDAFARSYDLAGSGLHEAFYVRIDGNGDDPGGGSAGFDLDAMGAIHVPNPKLCPGDCDCNGAVGFTDIDFFVASIPNNQTAWTARFAPGVPTCSFSNCDVNGNGNVGFDDIDPFVALIPSACR